MYLFKLTGYCWQRIHPHATGNHDDVKYSQHLQKPMKNRIVPLKGVQAGSVDDDAQNHANHHQDAEQKLLIKVISSCCCCLGLGRVGSFLSGLNCDWQGHQKHGERIPRVLARWHFFLAFTTSVRQWKMWTSFQDRKNPWIEGNIYVTYM